jgi:hypothetical protein
MPSQATPQPMMFRVGLKNDPLRKIAPILLTRLQLTIQRKQLPYPWPSSTEDELQISTVGSSQSLVDITLGNCTSITPLGGKNRLLRIKVQKGHVYDFECQVGVRNKAVLLPGKDNMPHYFISSFSLMRFP